MALGGSQKKQNAPDNTLSISLTVWAENRDHCMGQKDPAGDTVSLTGLLIVLNGLRVMTFQCLTLGKLLFF